MRYTKEVRNKIIETIKPAASISEAVSLLDKAVPREGGWSPSLVSNFKCFYKRQVLKSGAKYRGVRTTKTPVQYKPKPKKDDRMELLTLVIASNLPEATKLTIIKALC